MREVRQREEVGEVPTEGRPGVALVLTSALCPRAPEGGCEDKL